MKGHRKLWALFVVFGLSGALVPDRLGAFSPGEQESIETRLQRLEDREGILQLLRDYGRHLDNRDFASFSQLFAEKDGEWIGGMGRAKSRQGIRKLMEDTIGRDATGKGGGGPNYHLFMNEIITLNGNEARATTKWMFVVQNSSKQPQPFYLGHYEDTLVKENGRWKFLKRIVYGDIPPDDPLSRM
ncbi:MAG: hypothetical protein H6Q07_690 [Acidobacteria bacterium]|nr:hypothetical protein [Acidobacteriota bacterium]